MRALRGRSWPLATTALVIGTGMAYSLWWPAVVRRPHIAYWLVPGDIWLTVRDAHYVAWGSLPYIYGTGTALVALPGMAILLAPLAAIAGHAGLSESFGPWMVPHPTSWLLYGPFVLASNGVVLFALDAWVEELGIGGWRRGACSLASAAVTWETAARWGHPEDLIALGLGLYALLAAKRGRRAQAGWLLGGAACFQPLVVLLLPLVVAASGWRTFWLILARAAVLPGALVVASVVMEPADALRALVGQPNFPNVDHPTPWSLLSPHLAHGVIGAGPARAVAVMVAFAIGWWAWRSRGDWRRLLWFGACMLGTRGVFEAVMVPYYVVPAMAVAVLAAWSSLRPWRAGAATALAMATVWMTNTGGGMWGWWLEASALVVATLAVSSPLLAAGERRAEVSGPGAARSELQPPRALAAAGAGAADAGGGR